jgi:hypothetical protein
VSECSYIPFWIQMECCCRRCFPIPSSTLAAAIIQHGQEAVVYLGIPFENSLVHAVFDPHPRSDHPSGPSFLISRKPIHIHASQIFASPISDNSETFAYRIQRIFSNRVTALGVTLDATSKTVHQVSKEQLDLDEGALRKPAFPRTSWTMIESDPLLVHGGDRVCLFGLTMPTATQFSFWESTGEYDTRGCCGVDREV